MRKDLAWAAMVVVALALVALLHPGKGFGLLTVKEPNTLIAWAYFWWNPKQISAGGTTYLNGGITVITIYGYSSYSVDIRVYDNNPRANGPPVITSSSLTGCNVELKFVYDNSLKAWRFYSGVCNYYGRPGIYNFGITARWQPTVKGSYTGESYVCLHEPPATGCESAYDVLTVR